MILSAMLLYEYLISMGIWTDTELIGPFIRVFGIFVISIIRFTGDAGTEIGWAVVHAAIVFAPDVHSLHDRVVTDGNVRSACVG